MPDDVPDGEFAGIFESLIVWKNHRYIQDLSANVRRGHDAAVYASVEVDGKTLTGFSAGGPAPAGYQAARIQVGVKPSGKPLERVYCVKTEDADLRERVGHAWRMALEYARAGRMIEISRIHQACNVHKTLSTYYHFFRSVTYKGTRHVGERLVEGAHEGYVSPEEWDLVQRFVSRGCRPSPKVRHPQRVNSPFYLSGRVVCGYCGSRLDFEQDNRAAHYTALRCAGRKRDLSSCQLSKLSYGAFMEQLLELIRKEILTEERLRAIVADVNQRLTGSGPRLAEERRRLVKEIAAARRAVDRLLDALEDGEDLSRLRDRLGQRERELAELEGQLERVTLEERLHMPVKASRELLRSTARRLKEGLDAGDPDTVRAILQGLVKRVIVWNEKARVEFMAPSALFEKSTPDFKAMLWRARGDSNPRSPA